MKRVLRYTGRIHRDLRKLESDTQGRILAALERFAATGDGDIRPLRGEFAGSYRLRVGKWHPAGYEKRKEPNPTSARRRKQPSRP